MDSIKFKKKFGEVANGYNFEKAFGGWFKESLECIVVLDLQKSNFGNYYEVNIKIFVQGMFGNNYVNGKDLVKKHSGDIFTRQPDNFDEVLDLDISMHNDDRTQRIDRLFNEFIKPLSDKAISRKG